MAESTSDKEKTAPPQAEPIKKVDAMVQITPKAKDLPEPKKAPPAAKKKTTKAPAEPKPKKIVLPPSINNIILNSAIKIAKDVGAKSIFLFADIVEDLKQLEDISKKGNFVFLTKNIEMIKAAIPTGEIKIIELPSVDLTRTAITFNLAAKFINPLICCSLTFCLVTYVDRIQGNLCFTQIAIPSIAFLNNPLMPLR